MPQFIVNKTKSFTIVASTESGNATLVLADDLRETLKEMLENIDTSEEAAAGFLDILGDDAPLLIEAIAQMSGIKADLASIYAEAGLAGVEEAIVGHSPNAGALADIGAALEGRSEFGGFTVAKPSDLGDIFGYGMPDFGDPDPNTEEGAAAIEKLIGDARGGQMEGNEEKGWGDIFWEISGDAFNMNPAMTGGAFVVGAVLTGVIVIEHFKRENEAEDQEPYVGYEGLIPADPNAEYEGWMDFTPPWVEAQMKEGATYGQTLVDPNSERGIQGTKEFDPEAELNGLILTDPEAVKDAITAAEAQEAADFHYVSTTTPVEAEFQFKPDLGDNPDFGTGDDYSGPSHGDAMATATEYIVKVQGDDDLSLQDTMIFNASLQSVGVDAEGTSGALLEGQISQDEANGFFVPEIM
ncbi:hypothetical protein A8B78_06325 [Jannaschia sp. EhC01]|nr:hypothetical protein A8B78_06325 [Jannaschia sp. EhC01]